MVWIRMDVLTETVDGPIPAGAVP
eukprot:SAG31_NODE_28288_length_412_cov_0.980831_2_plen_23_part_01